MEDDQKNELIQSLNEMVSELTAKLINLRVQAGLQLKAKDKEIAALRARVNDTPRSDNLDSSLNSHGDFAGNGAGQLQQ